MSCRLLDADWLNMRCRRILHATLFYGRILAAHRPPYLFKKISFRTDVHTLNLRFRGTLTPPIHKTELFKKAYTFQVYRMGNYIVGVLGGCASEACLRRLARERAAAGFPGIDV